MEQMSKEDLILLLKNIRDNLKYPFVTLSQANHERETVLILVKE